MFEAGFTRKGLRGQLIWFLLWVFVTFMGLFVLEPSASGHGTHMQVGLPSCPSAGLFRRPCPGCGLTTSWTNILHGNIGEAFASNWAGPILYLTFTASALMALFGYTKKLRVRTDTKFVNLYLSILIGTFLVYGLVRMATTTYASPSGLSASSAAQE